MTTESRLIECFASVFPDAPRDQLSTATSTTLPGWDSIALATLIATVEEEFGVILPAEDYGSLNSFAAFLGQLGEK